jgi:hypothetical protein
MFSSLNKTYCFVSLCCSILGACNDIPLPPEPTNSSPLTEKIDSYYAPLVDAGVTQKADSITPNDMSFSADQPTANDSQAIAEMQTPKDWLFIPDQLQLKDVLSAKDIQDAMTLSDKGVKDLPPNDIAIKPDQSPPPTCNDGIKNGKETDKDCGGGTCPACVNNKSCAKSSDCISQACVNNKCDTWFSTSFSNRIPITIHNTGGELSNYQVAIIINTDSLIQQGQMRSNCADIRITDTNKTTLLSHWLAGECNSASTKIWAKIPSIGASSNKVIYLYYGSPTASSTSSFNDTFIDANGDFEIDPEGTEKSNLTYWDHASGTVGISGNIDSSILPGSSPCLEEAFIEDSAGYSGNKSFFSFLQNCNSGDLNVNRNAIQRIFTEGSYRAVANNSTVYIWLSEVYTLSSLRYYWSIAMTITDGTNYQTSPLVCKDWGKGEGCGTGDAYDYYDQSSIGADGELWKRYSVTIPAGFNTDNLTIVIGHIQDSWDRSTAGSFVYYDNIGGIRLRKFSSPEPTTSNGTAEKRIAN